MDNFLKDEHFNKLDEAIKESLESSIDIKELDEAVKTLNVSATPGCDGLSLSFFIHFWSKLRQPYFKSLVQAIQEKTLGVTQKRGVISLIHKDPKLPRDSISDYRPVTLTNIGY